MRRTAPFLLLALAPALARASDSDLTEVVTPIAIVGTVFGFTALMIAIVAYGRFRNQRLRHETIRLAIEKGQPLPADVLDPVRRRDPRTADLRRGLVLLALGLGAGLFLYFANPPGAPEHTRAVGFVPGLMGVAYLVSHALARPNARDPQAGGE